MTDLQYNYEPWVGFDLDGTLAHYDGWVAPDVIGAPIARMVDLVKVYRQQGVKVKIFTARVWEGYGGELAQRASLCRAAIKVWCKQYIGEELEVTNIKDLRMTHLYDDRAIQVEANTGRIFNAILEGANNA